MEGKWSVSAGTLTALQYKVDEMSGVGRILTKLGLTSVASQQISG